MEILEWSTQGLGDKVELLLNGTTVVDQHTLTDATEIGQPVILWVASHRWQTGSHTLSYRVTRLNQQAETLTPPVKLYVKFELPGGQDLDPGYGHSELFMYIPQEIVDGGVDKETAEQGVPIVIRAESGNGSPYPDAAVGDVIKVSWGGKYQYSDPLTALQISDPANNPILITITKDTIEAAGDSDSAGLAVSFIVHDLVNNEAEDWCKETRIVVATDISLLPAAIVEETQNNVLDLEKLGDADVTVQVWGTSPPFESNDEIVVKLRGTTLEGEAVEVTTDPQTVNNLPHVYEFEVDNAQVRKLAKTQAIFSYQVTRAGSPDPLRSKGRFVQVVGEATRLAAPIADDAQHGSLDPDLTNIRIRIPFDPLIVLGSAIELIWFGTRPDNSSYQPALEWFFPNKEEAEDPAGFTILVEGKHLKTLKGGKLDLSYNLLIDEDGEIVRRGSRPAAQLLVGEPQFELVKPIVLGEKDGALEPADLANGTSQLTAPRPTATPTKSGDKVTYTWVGEVSGKTEDTIDINALNADKNVPFNLSAAFVAQHIEANRGKNITASYRIWRKESDTTSYSNPLEFLVGQAFKLETPPGIKQAEADGKTLQPLKAKDALTAVIPQAGLLPSDLLSVTWKGAAGTAAGGSHTTQAKPVSETGFEVALPVSVLAFNLSKTVTLTFTITRNGKAHPSPARLLNVGTLPLTSLNSPKITDADANDVLDLSTLGSKNVIIHALDWPLMAIGQHVWMSLAGFKAGGGAHDLVIWAGGASYVNGTWFEQGFWEKWVINSYFKELAHDSKLTLSFKAALDKSNKVENALTFKDQVYTIKAVAIVTPTITEVKDPKGKPVPHGSTTVETSVTLSGMASKGLEVEIFDGTTTKGKAPVDPVTGIWSRTVTGLTPVGHSFTAKALYGAGASSAARTLTVVPVVTPTITEVKDLKGKPVPHGSTTVETSVTLSGLASKGLEVEIFDDTTTKGKAPVDPVTGIWSRTVTGLTPVGHSFTAKALYGSDVSSAEWRITVLAMYDRISTFTNFDWDGWYDENNYTRIAKVGDEYFVESYTDSDAEQVSVRKEISSSANATYEISVDIFWTTTRPELTELTLFVEGHRIFNEKLPEQGGSWKKISATTQNIESSTPSIQVYLVAYYGTARVDNIHIKQIA
ncbi:hypothetical protein [Pseudomonas sp. P1.8]|uniref:hypothetical protein n=1 Tax=Pseudomonas sp. P1.8 TaxID=1699310 RepID=UPI0012E2117C|nr:hypothetical protein [Pseudomonas sp. P1.8]